MPVDTTATGYTVRDLARRWRIGREKIMRLIRRGELPAVNLAGNLCGRPQYRITPEAVAVFERGRTAAAPKPTPKRRQRTAAVDYFPG